MRHLINSLILLALTNYSMGQGRTESNSRDTNKKRRVEVFTKWINENNIVFGRLPKANPKDLIYDCDLTLILKQIKGDTIVYWTKSSWYTTGGIYLDNDIKELNKLIEKESFGLTDYVEKLDDQGNVVLVSLWRERFKVESDSLFRLTSFLKIPQDSIDKAITDRDFKLAERLLKENTYFKFVLIFHPNIFKDRAFTTNEVGVNITLDHVWKVGEKTYYEISFNRDNFGTMIKFPIYLFDDQYRFLKYDGCNKSEIDQLTKDREVTVNAR